MDFEEFLWALGDTTTMPLVRASFERLQPMGRDEHELTMDRFREYLVVGGMPQAVARYVESHDLAAVDKIKRDIIELYRADMYKFAGALKSKVLSIFNGIPATLSKHGENALAAQNVHARLLTDDIALNEGMLMENVVAQMLCTAGHALYFYSRNNSRDASERIEIDFLLARSKTERNKNISPVEVKSSKRYTTTSLDRYREKFNPYLDKSFILHTKDLRIDDEATVRLPLYMAPLLVSRA